MSIPLAPQNAVAMRGAIPLKLYRSPYLIYYKIILSCILHVNLYCVAKKTGNQAYFPDDFAWHFELRPGLSLC